MLYDNYEPLLLYDQEAGGIERQDRKLTEWQHTDIGGYRVKLYKAGPLLEVHIYPYWQTKQAAGMAKRAQAAKLAQQMGDERRARQKLDRLIAANFVENIDYKIGLDYAKEPSPEQAYADVKKFIRAMRKAYKAAGIELKYIYVSQVITPTGRIRKRIHHHVIMTGGVDPAVIRKLWPHGRAHIDVLQPDGNGLAGLAQYLAGHVHGAKRWVSGKNLVIPQPYYPRHKIGMRTARQLENYETARTLLERQHKNYRVCSIDIRYSDLIPGAYIYVRMRR